MTEGQAACCSSPASICYWFVASLISWGVFGLIGAYWSPLRALSAATILFAMGIGCVANWLRNRTLHCVISGPVFLIAGSVLLVSGVATIRLNPSWVWLFVLAAVCVAFCLEWRYARRLATASKS